MTKEKPVKKLDNNLTLKRNISTISIEDRLHAFANIIVERILEDQIQGTLKYKVSDNK